MAAPAIRAELSPSTPCPTRETSPHDRPPPEPAPAIAKVPERPLFRWGAAPAIRYFPDSKTFLGGAIVAGTLHLPKVPLLDVHLDL